jgi:hypothetical protein
MLPAWLAVTLFAFGASVTLILGVWTWRRLWRHPITDPYTVVVYRYGVRCLGLLLFVAMTFIVPLFEADSPLGPSVASRRFWGDFVLRAMIGVPLWLWTGYWGGRTMAWVTGRRPGTPTLDRNRPEN